MVRADSGINSVKDLQGKKVAMSSIGSTSGHLGPSQLVKDNGLDPLQDIEVLHTSREIAWEALKNGDVAAWGYNGGTMVRQRDKDTTVAPGMFKIIARGPDLPHDVLVAAPHVDKAVEEVDPGPDMALTALGATRLGRLFAYVLPAACPAFIHTTLFSFERAVQSSVVLGLVGAGGIGMLLEEPMTWHNYDEAATILLLVFLMVMMVEQVCAAIRRRMM